MFIIGAILRWAVLVGYAACAWLYLSRLLSARPAENRGPEILLSLVVLLHGATLTEAALEHGRLIFLTTALQATTVYAIVLAVWTLLIGRKSRNQNPERMRGASVQNKRTQCREMPSLPVSRRLRVSFHACAFRFAMTRSPSSRGRSTPNTAVAR